MDKKQKIYDAKVDLFCQNMKSLLDDLQTLHPNDTTLSMCITMFNTVGTFYKEDIINQFIDIIKPFSEKILEKDESFFLNESPESFNDDQWILSEIEKIRKIWVEPETTDETKEAIWKYMITFVKIGKSLKKI